MYPAGDPLMLKLGRILKKKIEKMKERLKYDSMVFKFSHHTWGDPMHSIYRGESANLQLGSHNSRTSS